LQLSTRSIEPSFGLLFGDKLRDMGVATTGASVIMSTLDATINFSGMNQICVIQHDFILFCGEGKFASSYLGQKVEFLLPSNQSDLYCYWVVLSVEVRLQELRIKSAENILITLISALCYILMFDT
jgi:hypothetical protein